MVDTAPPSDKGSDRLPVRRTQLRFDAFTFDELQHQLRRGETVIHLQPKTADVLHHLLRNAHRLVEKDELLAAIWPGVVVTEHSLTRCIKDLRKALQDDAASPRIVQTVSRRGYRLLVQPEHIDAFEEDSKSAPVPAAARDTTAEAGSGGPAAPLPSAPRRDRRWAAVLVGLAVAIVLAAGWAAWRSRAEPEPTTLAVLPFVDLSAHGDAQGLADGLTEDLIELLAQAPSLRVAARTSAFTFRGPDVDARVVGRKLSVRWLIEGSVRREADRVRVVMHLVDTQTGYRAWSGRFDRETRELLRLQDEMARAAAERIVSQVSLPGALPLRPVHPAAYEAFVAGRELLYRRPPAWQKQSEAAFRAALALDPSFNRARAGLALALALRAARSPERAALLQEATSTAAAALREDPRSVMALSARALVKMDGQDLRGAKADLERAQQLDPSFALAYNWHHIVLQRLGLPGREQLDAGLRVDPLNPVLLGNLGVALSREGQPGAARVVYERMAALPSQPLGAYIALVDLDLAEGALVSALRWALRAEVAARPAFGVQSRLLAADVLARLGLSEEAARALPGQPAATMAAGGQFAVESALRCLGRLDELGAAAGAAPGPSADAPAWLAASRARALYLARRVPEAEKWWPLVRLDPEDFGSWHAVLDTLAARAWALHEAGPLEAATQVRAELRQWTARLPRVAAEADARVTALLATAALLDGRTAAALDLLEQANGPGRLSACTLRHDPRWTEMQGQARFVAVLTQAQASVDSQRAEVLRRRAAGEAGLSLISQ